ncbi:hypothetical protein MRX96_005263 [Rhipicephalus microplus]
MEPDAPSPRCTRRRHQERPESCSDDRDNTAIPRSLESITDTRAPPLSDATRRKRNRADRSDAEICFFRFHGRLPDEESRCFQTPRALPIVSPRFPGYRTYVTRNERLRGSKFERRGHRGR